MAAASIVPALRKLQRRFVSVADFDAFCLDHFPEVCRLEGPGDPRPSRTCCFMSSIPSSYIPPSAKRIPEKIQRLRSSKRPCLSGAAENYQSGWSDY